MAPEGMMTPVQPEDMITDRKESNKKNEIDYDALKAKIDKLTEDKDKTKLPQTLEGLLALEKTYRLQADLKATTMCCLAIVQVRRTSRKRTARLMCFECFADACSSLVRK